MRVLHVISELDSRAGGPAVALKGLATAQAAAGLGVTVVSTFRDAERPPDTAAALTAAGVEVKLIGAAHGPLRRHADIIPTVDHAARDADIVHIHTLWEEVQHQAARAALRHRRPYLIRPCGMLTPWSLAQSKWRKRAYLVWRLRRTLARAAALHFTTRAEQEETAEALRLPTASITEPNGVDLSEFVDLPSRGGFRSRYPAIGDRPLIAFLGRVHPGKGVEYLIPALARMKQADAMLLVIGPDSEGFQAQMQAEAQSLGVANRVVFAGMLRGPERVAALVDADLFSLPSDHENFGIAVVEALAAGKPVVISDRVGIAQEIRAAGVGAVVRREADELAAELSRWIGDPALRESAAARTRPFVWEQYDWAKIARRWADHYQRLLSAGPSASRTSPARSG
jgi:glycosyltransferase involved in cell wall biosynthesis